MRFIIKEKLETQIPETVITHPKIPEQFAWTGQLLTCPPKITDPVIKLEVLEEQVFHLLHAWLKHTRLPYTNYFLHYNSKHNIIWKIRYNFHFSTLLIVFSKVPWDFIAI